MASVAAVSGVQEAQEAAPPAAEAARQERRGSWYDDEHLDEETAAALADLSDIADDTASEHPSDSEINMEREPDFFGRGDLAAGAMPVAPEEPTADEGVAVEELAYGAELTVSPDFQAALSEGLDAVRASAEQLLKGFAQQLIRAVRLELWMQRTAAAKE